MIVSTMSRQTNELARNVTTRVIRFKSAVTTTRPKTAITTATATTSASTMRHMGLSESLSNSTSISKQSVNIIENVPMYRSVLAVIASIGTVSAGALLIEQGSSKNVPEFHPSRQRFDQSTFLGRFCHMVLACDPRLLLFTENEIRRCRSLVDTYETVLSESKNNNNPNVHRILWEAHRVASAGLHPDTGDIIPRPFRMSGYVPFNGPICVAMVASTSMPSLLFWSWVNQSQNALVNYCNRNASSEMTNATLAKSYGVAVTSALAVAFGLASLLQRRYDPTKAKALMRYVAFPSAVVASSLNCYVIRSPEIKTGIPILNDQGQDVLPGVTSKVAAKRGVHQTTASRAILQAPVYLLPPLLVGTVFKNFLTKNPALAVPLTTYMVLVSFGFGLPAAVAIFPQLSEIHVDDVEETFASLEDPNTGRQYTKFWYNKGL